MENYRLSGSPHLCQPLDCSGDGFAQGGTPHCPPCILVHEHRGERASAAVFHLRKKRFRRNLVEPLPGLHFVLQPLPGLQGSVKTESVKARFFRGKDLAHRPATNVQVRLAVPTPGVSVLFAAPPDADPRPSKSGAQGRNRPLIADWFVAARPLSSPPQQTPPAGRTKRKAGHKVSGLSCNQDLTTIEQSGRTGHPKQR